MIEIFLEKLDLPGNLIADSKDLGEARYIFSYNPYDLNNMRVKVVDPPWEVMKNDFKDIRLISTFSGLQYEIVLNTNSIAESLSLTSRTIDAQVSEFITENQYDDLDKVDELTTAYNFPLTTISDNTDRVAQHWKYGFFSGSLNSKSNDVELMLGKGDLILDSKLGCFEVSDQYQFHDPPKIKLYKINTFVNESYCKHVSSVNPDSYSEYIQKVQNKVNQIFRLLSLVERNRINWTKELVSLRGGGKPVFSRKTYRWSSPPSKNYNPKLEKKRDIRNTLKLLVDTFETLDSTKQETILKTLYNFEVANCSPTLESKLIHWHSCLDFFKKEFATSSKKFSQSLVEIFDGLKLSIEDLVGKDILDLLRSHKNKGCFRFTELRNMYVHDGFDAFKGIYDEAYEEILIMRAIAERLLLKYMNVNFKDTCLGKL